MQLLIALIPALPLAGFMFAVFVGPRLDLIPTHRADHPADHGAADGADAEHHAQEVDESSFR